MPLPSTDGLAAVLRRSGMGAPPSEWRLPPIETYPQVVAFAQTHVGKLLLFVSFAALLNPLMEELWLATTRHGPDAGTVQIPMRSRRYHSLHTTSVNQNSMTTGTGCGILRT